MNFEIVGQVERIETIASGRMIRELARLRKFYGRGRWRKMKGIATIRLANGRIVDAELHWYEAHGIGRKDSRSSGCCEEHDEDPQEEKLRGVLVERRVHRVARGEEDLRCAARSCG